jgi:hypothetical protein
MKNKVIPFFLSLTILVACSENEDSEKKSVPPYVGDKVDGKMHGLGYFTNSKGEPKVLGEFKNDSINGIAELNADNGGYYLGQWKNDRWNGIGKAKWTDGKNSGDSCIAHFSNAKLNGFGHYFNSNGEIYIGFYEDGQQNGYGCHQYTKGELKGDYFVGEIKNGMMHGEGYYYNAEEDIAAYVLYDNGTILRQDTSLRRYVDSLELQIGLLDVKLYEEFKLVQQKFEIIKEKIEKSK